MGGENEGNSKSLEVRLPSEFNNEKNSNGSNCSVRLKAITLSKENHSDAYL